MMNRFLVSILVVLLAVPAFAGDYYDHGSFPTTNSSATSASMRAELDLIAAGFAKFPSFSGNGSKPLILNSGATGYTFTTGTLTLAGNFAISGAYATTLTVTGATTVTLPTTGTLATLAGTESLSNKTISGATGITSVGTITTGVWNGTVLLGQYGGTGVANIGKTITLGGNLEISGAYATTLTVTGATTVTLPTTGTLATLAGTESLSNKTIASPVFSGTASGTYTLGGTPTLTIADNTFTVSGSADTTKKIAFEVDGVTTGTTRTLTVQDSSDTLVGRATTDTLTNKTLTAPVLNGTITGTYTLGGTPTIPGTLTAGTPLVQATLAYNTTVTQAHGLGATPDFINAYIECLTAEFGWSIGDRIVQGSPFTSNAPMVVGDLVANATNLIWRPGIGGGVFQVTSKTDGSLNTATAGSWKYVAVPYKLN